MILIFLGLLLGSLIIKLNAPFSIEQRKTAKKVEKDVLYHAALFLSDLGVFVSTSSHSDLGGSTHIGCGPKRRLVRGYWTSSKYTIFFELFFQEFRPTFFFFVKLPPLSLTNI